MRFNGGSATNPELNLRRMNEAGVLGRFIPEFGKIVSMMQFNMYHHYTVDEHLIRTVEVLSEIDNGKAEEVHPLANKIMPEIEDRQALYVAILLHDIAKGRQEDHSTAGAKVALLAHFGRPKGERVSTPAAMPARSTLARMPSARSMRKSSSWMRASAGSAVSCCWKIVAGSRAPSTTWVGCRQRVTRCR